jgi:hypothetical protein
MEDPRTVFHVGEDRQVLVLLEWEGPAGTHRCEGRWRDPSGRVVFTSTAEVTARSRRFAVYWGLSLPDLVSTGTWVLEASIDGEAAGAHSFQVLPSPVDPAAPPPPQVLGVADLYRRAVEATLSVQSVDAAGVRLEQASGVLVARDLVLTTFGVLNNARSLLVLDAEGRRSETTRVVSWSRRENWALLRIEAADRRLPARATRPIGIGDRCAFLDVQSDGSRVVVEAHTVGRSPAGEFVMSEYAFGSTLGAPVLDERGEVVGVVAGPSGVVGADRLDLAAIASEGGGFSRGGRIRTLPPLPSDGAATRSLEDFDRAGEFVRPLARTPHFVVGVLGTGVEQTGPSRIPVAQDQKFRFSRREKTCVVFVTWTPAQKQDSTVGFELFDEGNRRVGASNPTRMRLRPGRSFVHTWPINLPALTPGIYRVDVKLGADPVWRTFFRVTE